MKTKIQDFKKGGQFVFNAGRYTVKRKWMSKNKPLITECGESFEYKELKVDAVRLSTHGKLYK